MTAFLRGIKPRAWLFMDWYYADQTSAARIWPALAQEFNSQAPAQPLPQWPVLFWQMLLKHCKQLAQDDSHTVAIAGLGPLARGPRAIVLLRLLAPLDEASNAAVLGLPLSAYRSAFTQVLPRLHDGRVDAQSWRILQQRANQILRGTSTSSAAPVMRKPPPQPRFTTTAKAKPWQKPLMWAIAVLTCVALALTFIPHPPPEPALPEGALADALIHAEALPQNNAPAAVLTSDEVLISSPDFPLLLHAPNLQMLQDLAFYQWYAAELALQQRIAAEAAETATQQLQEVHTSEENTDDAL